MWCTLCKNDFYFIKGVKYFILRMRLQIYLLNRYFLEIFFFSPNRENMDPTQKSWYSNSFSPLTPNLINICITFSFLFSAIAPSSGLEKIKFLFINGMTNTFEWKKTSIIITFLCNHKKTKNLVQSPSGPFLASIKLIGTNV